MAYYYLISSLPSLSASGSQNITYSDFLESCRPNVSEKVFSRLEALTADSEEGAFMKRWQEEHARLSRELAYRRNLRRGLKKEEPQDVDPYLTKRVNALLDMESPLEAERELLAIELERVDEITKMHYFDEYVLFGYALKLRLLERFASFKREDGLREFNGLIKKIQTQMGSEV